MTKMIDLYITSIIQKVTFEMTLSSNGMLSLADLHSNSILGPSKCYFMTKMIDLYITSIIQKVTFEVTLFM